MGRFLDFLALQQLREANYVSDLARWSRLAYPGILENKDQRALQRTWMVRGRDLVSETKEAQGARMLQANEVLKRLGGKWMLQSEAQRTRVTTYPVTSWRFPVAALIDADRREAILTTPGARETRYYLTLTWQPPQAALRAAQRLVVANLPASQEGEAGEEENALKTFLTQTDYLMQLLRGLLATCEACLTDQMLTYLHTQVSNRWHPVRWSGNALDIDTQLCDTPYFGGWYPSLGHPDLPDSWHLRTCSFYSYPPTSHVGMVKHLEGLDLDFRWCTRWLGMEKAVQQSLLRQTQHAWVRQEKNFAAQLGENLSGREARVIDSDARNKAEEADAARQELGADIVAYGEFTSTITVWDTDPQVAEEKLQTVRHAFEAQGFVLQPERVHSREAWLSSHTGNRHSSVRKTKQSSLFLAHLLPGLHAAWTGPEFDAELDGPPWFYAHTEQSTIFRVVNHVRDIGHFMMLGPTGTGKSTMVGLGVAQWYKYRGAQAAVYDVGRTARLITLLLGGQWIDLGSGNIQLQPLRHIDRSHERIWALNWLLRLVEAARVPLKGVVQEYLARRLDELAARPRQERTLSMLLHLCEDQTRRAEARVSAGTRDAQGLARPDPYKRERVELQHDVQRALRPFVRGGEYGFLLDGDHDDLEGGHLYTFEQKTLLTFPRLIEPVIQHCFHLTEQRFSTERPMLLVLEEAALVALLPLYKEKFDAWLMTLRKEGVSVGFVINSVRQAASLGLGLLTEENCPTRFYFPNVEATTPNIATVYDQFGLNTEEIQMLAQARPYRDIYYVNRELGRRLFHLPLSPFVLDCLAHNDDADHALMDRLFQEEGREGFAAAWMRHHGHDEAVITLERRHDATPLDSCRTTAARVSDPQ